MIGLGQDDAIALTQLAPAAIFLCGHHRRLALGQCIVKRSVDALCNRGVRQTR